MTCVQLLLAPLVLATFCLFAPWLPATDAARILVVSTSPSKSHMLIHCSVADTLARAAHDVTVIGSVPNVYKQAKYRYVSIDGGDFDSSMFTDMINKPKPLYMAFGSLMSNIATAANESLSHPTMQQFLHEHGEGSFDLIIIGYFMDDFVLGLGGHFRCPIVISFMVQPIQLLDEKAGNPAEAAYVPTVFSMLKQPMNFLGRVKNFLVSMVEQYGLGYYLKHTTNYYYAHHFPADRYPPLEDVRKNISLIFVNHHSVSQGPIRPNVPNLIEIGGIQIKEKPDPLPTDIAKLLDESKEGIIYFSLGSNIQGSHLSAEKAKFMFNVISKLPYKVLWKWGDSDFPGQSSNIIYKNWMPQDDILAHPNVKLFITHCGQGGVVESQYHGVPMVGIPLFGDQPANAANMEQAGFGLTVDYISMTEKSLNAAIQEVLNNPKYTEAVRAFSKLYRDRPMTARQSVRYWVDYVLRYNGAKHLQSPAIHLNGWQLMSLDVIAFLLAIVAIVVGVAVKLCQLVCCRKKSKAANVRVPKSKKNK